MAIGTTAAILGASVIGGATSMIAGSKAVGAARDAAATQAATDQYIVDTARSDNEPWRNVGVGALGKLASLYGLGTDAGGKTTTDWTAYVNGNPDALANWNAIKGNSDGAQFNGDIAKFGQYHYGADGSRRDLTTFRTATSSAGGQFGDFVASPGYQFRMDQSLKAIERSAAARGGLRSGATMKALNDYAQGTASDEFARYTGQLGALAGIGQSANQANQQAGAQYAANQAQTNAQMGAARSSAYQNTGNAINNTVGNLAGMYLYTQGYGKKA